MRWRALAVAALLVSLVPVPTFPHAYVETSSPADGATVSAPREIVIRFTEDVEFEFSTIAVKNQTGEAMHQGRVRQPASNTLSMR